MGGKSSPDYGDMAVAQGEANEGVVRDQTYANRPTQYTPWGYTSWDANAYTDPGSNETTTQWSQTQGLTPELQALLDKNIALQGGRTDIAGGLVGRMGDEFGQKLNYDGLNPMAGTPQGQYTLPESYEGIQGLGDPARMRARAEDAYMGKATSRLDPQYAGKRQAAETRMRNQGLGPEDSAWQSQMAGLGQQETDAYGQAQYDAVRAGLGEQSQLFGQDMGQRQQSIGEANSQFGQALSSNQQNYGMNQDAANYANQIRQQQLAETQGMRNQSLNEINALMSGQQVGSPAMPNFSQATAAQPAPIYQAGVDQGNFDQASSPWAGIGSLAGTLGGAYLGGGG